MITTILGCFASVPIIALLVSPMFKHRIWGCGKVLLFHSLQPSVFDAGSLPFGRFKALVQFAQLSGHRFGTIEEALADPSVVSITFDDGYSDSVEVSNFLSEQRIPLTVFVPTRFIGEKNSWDNFLLRSRRRHLSYDEIKKLAKAGVRFGSHGHTHRDLTTLVENDLRKELAESKTILENLTNQPTTCFAYPFGKRTDRIDTLAREVGYRYGFGSLPAKSDGFYRGRIPIGLFDTRLALQAKLNPGILTGAEYMKSATITALSRLTPLITRLS